MACKSTPHVCTLHRIHGTNPAFLLLPNAQGTANSPDCPWEDQTKIFALGDAPAQWTVYCIQFPKSHTFHMDTAAWHCHTRTNIPWQLTPHLTALSTSHLPFQCSNSQCIWFALPVGHNGQYIVSHQTIGTFCSTLCVPCLLSRLVPKMFCRIHTSNASYPELSGVLFVDHEGNVAVAEIGRAHV